jgi:hypothetical protein
MRTPRRYFGLIYEACGEDLDGQTPEDWARSAGDPGEYALRAVRQLAQDYEAALAELGLEQLKAKP